MTYKQVIPPPQPPNGTIISENHSSNCSITPIKTIKTEKLPGSVGAATQSTQSPFVPLPLVNHSQSPSIKTSHHNQLPIKTEHAQPQVPVLPDFETLTKIVAQQQSSSGNDQKTHKALKSEATAMAVTTTTNTTKTQTSDVDVERLRAKYKHLKDKYNRLLQRHRERKNNKRKRRQKKMNKIIKSEETNTNTKKNEEVRVMGISDIKIPKYSDDKAAQIKLELEQKLFGSQGLGQGAGDSQTSHKKEKKRPRMCTVINEKMYKCSYCDHEFSRHHHLVRHERMHTGEKPFKCDEIGCDKRFHRNDYLNRHKLSDHGVNPYSCQQCNKTFRTKKLFDKHQYKYHPDFC